MPSSSRTRARCGSTPGRRTAPSWSRFLTPARASRPRTRRASSRSSSRSTARARGKRGARDSACPSPGGSSRSTAGGCGSSRRRARARRSRSRSRCASSGWWRPGEPADPARRGPRGQPPHRPRSAHARRVRGDRGLDRRGRGRHGRAPPAGSHPDGQPAPRARRVRGHAADQGPAGAPRHRPDRRHLVRPEPRRRQGARGRLRCLRDQALQPPRAAGQDPRVRAVRTPPRILIADDNAMNLDILQTRLALHGYDIITATDGEAALAAAREKQPDLVLLDVMMPKVDGLEVCRRLRGDPDLPFMPIILVTARTDTRDVVAGLEAGGDEYLTKPVDQPALVARVKSMLRIKALHDTVQEQAARLEAQAAELRTFNRTLEERVRDQVSQLERMGRLKRFFSPQLAELIVAGGAEDPLQTHRRQVTVVFLDLRGFTAFAETAEPEEVMMVLREYHVEMGQLVMAHEGTLERFTGDGMMIFFNDPVPVTNPAERAVRMAVAMRDRVNELSARWRKRGYDLALGVGIAEGYATIGAIGFEGRWDYGAIGTVTNLAARLCGEAQGGEVLVTSRVAAALEDLIQAQEMGALSLKGLLKPVPTFSVIGLRPTG